MMVLKTIPLVLLLTLFSVCSYSQTDEDSLDVEDDSDTATQLITINQTKARKRGVYKTYEEYLNDSPSVEAEFTAVPLKMSKNNPLIVEARVKYKGKRPKKIWGISDGENVYIRVTMGQFLKNHYLRLQCDGPMPYVFIVEKIVLVPMGLGVAVAATTAVGTAALPSFVTLSLVRTETNYFKPLLLGTNARVKRVLKEYPELLEAYKQEPKHNKATKAKYITEYNRRKMKER